MNGQVRNSTSGLILVQLGGLLDSKLHSPLLGLLNSGIYVLSENFVYALRSSPVSDSDLFLASPDDLARIELDDLNLCDY